MKVLGRPEEKVLTLRIAGALSQRLGHSSQPASCVPLRAVGAQPPLAFENRSFRYINKLQYSRRSFQSTATTKAQDYRMAHQTFPKDIPVPKDDGAYDHLGGYTLPNDLALPIARSPTQTVNLSKQDGLTILFCYPRTARPDETVPDEWNAIPGARGCTPQACSFRDNFTQLKQLGVSQVYGISTQSPSYQAEVHERLHLPYDLLSDEGLVFQKALKLPTFDWEGGKVLRRSSIAVKGGKVVRWFYPVFPPDKGVDDVIAWLKESK